MTSGLFKETIYRHYVEQSFPIPLKYTDVIRSTHIDLDVAQEKRIDD